MALDHVIVGQAHTQAHNDERDQINYLLGDRIGRADVFARAVPAPRSDVLSVLGASLMQQGNLTLNLSGENLSGMIQMGDQSLLGQVQPRTKGKLRLGGVFATGGYQGSDVLSIWLPQMLASDTGVCIMGDWPHNDIGGYGKTASATIAISRQILDATIQAGILPIMTTTTPNDAFTNPMRVEMNKYLKWLRQYCRKRHIPLADTWEQMIQPGYGSGYGPMAGSTVDGIHWNASTVCNVIAPLVVNTINEALSGLVMPKGVSVAPLLTGDGNLGVDPTFMAVAPTPSATSGTVTTDGVQNSNTVMSATTAVGSTSVTIATATIAMKGRFVTHANLPPGTRILDVPDATHLTVSKPATAAGAATLYMWKNPDQAGGLAYYANSAAPAGYVQAVAVLGSLLPNHRIRVEFELDVPDVGGGGWGCDLRNAAIGKLLCGYGAMTQPINGIVRWEFVTPASTDPTGGYHWLLVYANSPAGTKAGFRNVNIFDITAEEAS